MVQVGGNTLLVGSASGTLHLVDTREPSGPQLNIQDHCGAILRGWPQPP